MKRLPIIEAALAKLALEEAMGAAPLPPELLRALAGLTHDRALILPGGEVVALDSWRETHTWCEHGEPTTAVHVTTKVPCPLAPPPPADLGACRAQLLLVTPAWIVVLRADVRAVTRWGRTDVYALELVWPQVERELACDDGWAS